MIDILLLADFSKGFLSENETSILSMSQDSNLTDFAMRQAEITRGQCSIVTFLRAAWWTNNLG